jgi:hypothetical protein
MTHYRRHDLPYQFALADHDRAARPRCDHAHERWSVAKGRGISDPLMGGLI